MMIARILLVLLFMLPTIGWADDQELSLNTKIKQLVQLRKATLDAPNDATRLDANSEFLKVLRGALDDQKSFKAEFDTIPQIADLRSEDKFFRMINWNVPMDDGTHRYYCFVQHYDRKAKQYVVTELKRGYRGIEGEERKVFNDRDWYGALYYKIITAKMKRNSRKRTYMVLGWDGHNEFSTIKFVDVMVITPKDIRFGEDIFNWPDRKNIRRVILEYKSSAAVSLRYDEKKKQIIFNKLVPLEPDLEGLPEFYIPLLEFSGLTWKRGKWFFVEDVDARMDDGKKTYINPPLPQKLD
jgi:hypothetical protein